MNLYDKYAKEFSNSRQSPWLGWTLLLDKVKDKIGNNIKVLDLGCGNGRFLQFLKDSKVFNKIDYYGLDNSQELINISLIRFPEGKFELKNLEDNNWNNNLPYDFDFIVGFGLMHHMHSFSSRQLILANSFKLLKKEGYLVLTYWQFAILERYKRMILDPKKFPDFKLNNNDFLLSFGKQGAFRFCHYCDEEEMQLLNVDTKLKELYRFYSDGKDYHQNLYVIYIK